MRHADIFNDIYTRKNVWHRGSGDGSLPQHAAPYMRFLSFFIDINGIRSVLDVGCGDWQFSRHLDWSKVDYTGVDVSSVVLANTRTFEKPGVRFREMDASRDALPAADLLIMKDVMQHWSNDDIAAFLPKLGGFKFALLTNYLPGEADQINNAIPTGGWRGVNLALAPFHLRGAFVYWYAGPDPKGVFLWQNPTP